MVSPRRGGKGSHRVFTHPTYPFAITLAAHGSKIKTGYIREIREAFQAIEEQNRNPS
jgi:predicted RNA binding protein YcfA (HicA-like mRNA interferase family)